MKTVPPESIKAERRERRTRPTLLMDLFVFAEFVNARKNWDMKKKSHLFQCYLGETMTGHNR